MKKILYLIILFISSCSERTAESEKKQESKFAAKIEAIKHRNKGIILTSKAKLYNQEQKLLKDVDNVYGQIVQIEKISKYKYDLGNTGERCNLHNYVRVSSPKINGWIYGDVIFEVEDTHRDTTFVIDNIKFKIMPTKNFGIGVYDKDLDGLSFCGKGNQSPIILYNSKFQKEEYIPVPNNQATYGEGYFTLDYHDGWTDKITNATLKNDTLRLTILREFQEGYADIELEISLNANQSTGRVIKYLKRDQ